MASFHLFWLTEGITKWRAIFPLLCASLWFWVTSTPKSVPPLKPCLYVCQYGVAKTVCVCGSNESRNQMALSHSLFLLITGRLLSVPSFWCHYLSILTVPSPNYSCFYCYPFEIYDHKDSGLEVRGIEAQICARDLLSLVYVQSINREAKSLQSSA